MLEDKSVQPGAMLAGRYRLLRRLKRGGQADIFVARDEATGRKLVVKTSRQGADREIAQALRHEAEIMAKLRHPNVVELLDAGRTDDGTPFIVMEYLEGTELADLLSSRGALPPRFAISVVEQVADALQAAHRVGIVHRDLKPTNIIVREQAEGVTVKMLDFGTAKQLSEPVPAQTDIVVGTPEFMSPEQAEGREAEVEAPSDVFALSVLAYSLLTGRTPWHPGDGDQVMDEVAHVAPLPLHASPPWPAVEAVLRQGLAKSAAERYASAIELASALGNAMVDDGLLAGAGHQGPPAKRVTDP